MTKPKPKKQSWRGNPPPNDTDHNKFLNGIKEKGLLDNFNRLVENSGLFIRGRKERAEGAWTYETAYLFKSKDAFQQREPWIVCIDFPQDIMRLIIRPIPSGNGSIDIIPASIKLQFETCPDNERWYQLYIKGNNLELIAQETLKELQENYINVFG